jgi:hypothetical protein
VLKILVSAVQSRPCPPFPSVSCHVADVSRDEQMRASFTVAH